MSAIAPQAQRLLDKLHERADAEAGRLEPPDPAAVNGVHDYESAKPPFKK